MTTIPSRLAKLATSSTSIEQARRRSIDAYRAWYRSVRLARLAGYTLLCFFPRISFWPRASGVATQADLSGTRDCRSLRPEHLSLDDPYQDTPGVRKEPRSDGSFNHRHAASQEPAGVSGDHELLEAGGELSLARYQTGADI